MLQDLTLGQYLPGRSPVHRLDPRTKLVACAAAMAAVFAPGPVWGAAWTWPLLAVGLPASGIGPGYFLRGLRPFRWLLAFTLVIHAVATPGRPVAGLAWVTVEGLASGAGTAARLATAIAFSSLLTLTTNPVDLVWAFERLARPLARVGVPVGEFGVALLVAIRFFPIFQQEAERLQTALRARGLEPDARGGPVRRLRGLTPLVVPLFRQVFQRADTLALAMEIRGFRPGAPRTSRRAHRLGRAEWIALAAVGVTAAAAWAGGPL